MKPAHLFFFAAASLGVASAAQAFDFRSIGDAPAVMYDAPSQRGIKRFVAPPGMPIEVVHSAHGWHKVRDAAGDLAWVEAKAVTSKRSVVVTAANAVVRARPEESAAPVFTASKGVLMERIEPVTSGWLKVRHRDGQTGHVRAADVWGR